MVTVPTLPTDAEQQAGAAVLIFSMVPAAVASKVPKNPEPFLAAAFWHALAVAAHVDARKHA